MQNGKPRGRPAYRPCDCPPAPKLPFRPVLQVKPFEKVKVALLSREILGFLVHFDRTAKLSIPHAFEGTCEGCEAQMPMRWTGFAAGLETKGGAKPCLVPFPASCYRGMQDNGLVSTDMRGMVLEFERDGKLRNSPLYATRCGKVSDLRSIPPAFDVLEALMRLWNVDRIESPPELKNGTSVDAE